MRTSAGAGLMMGGWLSQRHERMQTATSTAEGSKPKRWAKPCWDPDQRCGASTSGRQRAAAGSNAHWMNRANNNNTPVA